MITKTEICLLGMILISGLGFWFALVGIFFKKKTTVIDITPTNIEVKVSAFESLEERIREETQQEIFMKKDLAG